MRSPLAYLFVVILIQGCLSSILNNKVDEWPEVSPPTLAGEYHVRGVLYIPYAELVEPFEAWYDHTNQRSRIDYYEGMMKTYQLGKKGDYGVSRKVVPMTLDKEEANIETCFEVKGEKDAEVEPQSVFPDVTGFQLMGQDVVEGHLCSKWQKVDVINTRVNTYTLWLTANGEKNVPVKYQMLGFNSLFGSHYDHYYLMYSDFQEGNIDPSVFDVDDHMKCRDFPGPGKEHIYTDNPMKEFVDNYEGHVDDAFDSFKKYHGKTYDNEKEHEQKKANFKLNMRFIHSKNRAALSYKLEPNHLTDLSTEEIKVLLGRKYTPGYNGGQPFSYTEDQVNALPEVLDWRIAGAVTPVKDQSVCGSCWSFGTAGSIEGAYFVKYGRRAILSQQAMVDCSWGFGNNGCDGGEDTRSYQWIMSAGGLPTEAEYGPYLGADGYCHIWNVSKTAVLDGYVNVTSDDANALKVALYNHGPISVAIDASHRSFAFYASGVYYEPECMNGPDQLDHAVLLVGYGKLFGKPYWLIKNSWSTHWGNDGYVLMSQEKNNCGVGTMPTYVILK